MPGVSGNPNGRPKRLPPPSNEVVIRMWAGRPDLTYAHRSIREPDGYVHDFLGWCRMRVCETLNRMTRSLGFSQDWRVWFESRLVAIYCDGGEPYRLIHGMATFQLELENSVIRSAYFAHRDHEADAAVAAWERKRVGA